MAALWSSLAARDWPAVGQVLAGECIYYDVPTGPAVAARGPRDILARLRLGLEPLASYENYDGRMVGEGETVMYEHSERWQWPSGETVVLPFVSVHRVVAGRIALWADYWDYSTLINAAPPGWTETLMSADMSWIYDATGEI